VVDLVAVVALKISLVAQLHLAVALAVVAVIL
jgi:hypothetical protein